MSFGLAAQGRGGSHANSRPVTRGNAPWSADRDKGASRAQDVGKGMKKGLAKPHPKKNTKH